MSKLGKRLIEAAQEGVAIARGDLDPKSYRVHHASDDDDVAVRRAAKGAFMFRSATTGRVVGLKGTKVSSTHKQYVHRGASGRFKDADAPRRGVMKTKPATKHRKKR